MLKRPPALFSHRSEAQRTAWATLSYRRMGGQVKTVYDSPRSLRLLTVFLNILWRF